MKACALGLPSVWRLVLTLAGHAWIRVTGLSGLYAMRAVLALTVFLGSIGAASAQSTGPVIAIPGRPGVPVIINGIEASYAVVEGDWGLAKGIQVQPTVYGGVPIDPDPHVGHYYPTLGKKPGYGRLEIEPPPNRPLPKPAPAYHQSWGAQSSPPQQQPQSQVPF